MGEDHVSKEGGDWGLRKYEETGGRKKTGK